MVKGLGFHFKRGYKKAVIEIVVFSNQTERQILIELIADVYPRDIAFKVKCLGSVQAKFRIA